MTVEQVKDVASSTPFQPFKLETTGGRVFEVRTPDHIFFGPPASRTIIIFDPDHLAHLVNDTHVASLTVVSPA